MVFIKVPIFKKTAENQDVPLTKVVSVKTSKCFTNFVPLDMVLYV